MEPDMDKMPLWRKFLFYIAASAVLAVASYYVFFTPLPENQAINSQGDTEQLLENETDQETVIETPQDITNNDLSWVAKYIRTYDGDWPPEVTVSPGRFACEEGEQGTPDFPITTEARTINGKNYCVTTTYDGSATGHSGFIYDYVTTVGNELRSVSFSLLYVSACNTYDEPKYSECQNEKNTFDLDQLVDGVISSR